MHAALLLAKVRIRVPVSGDTATVLTVVGFLVIAAILTLFAWSKIKEEGRTGWLWLGGWLTALVSVLATGLFVSRIGAPGEAYFPVAAGALVVGVAASLLMKMAEHPKLAMAFAALNGLAMVGKVIARWPLNIVSLGDDPQVLPAPATDPKVLVIFLLMAVFGALAVWVGRSSRD